MTSDSRAEGSGGARRGGGLNRPVVVLSLAVGLIAAATGIALAVRGSGSNGRTGVRLNGTFTLFTSAQPQARPCQPQPGYADITAGAPVVVRNERGATVATGSLSPGTAEPSKRGCVFHFTIRPLPVAASYVVSVGQRGGLPYSYADLKTAGWRVTMGLGATPSK